MCAPCGTVDGMAGDTEHGTLLGPRELIAGFDAAMRAGVAHQIVTHLPAGVSPSEVRQSFVEHIGGRRGACWQDLWDAWVDAGRGTVPVVVWRCDACRGRRIDLRTGRVCRTCAGRGSHRHTVQLPARHAPRPS